MICIYCRSNVADGSNFCPNCGAKQFTNQEVKTEPVVENKEPVSGDFVFPIEDVFTITGRGTIVTGRVKNGTVKVYDDVEIVSSNHETILTTVTGIEMFRKQLDEAREGDNCGLLLRGIKRDQVNRGDYLVTPGTRYMN